MPPQGLLLIAASLPKEWEARFIDENLEPASDADFEWSDAVLVSGMHVQRYSEAESAKEARSPILRPVTE